MSGWRSSSSRRPSGRFRRASVINTRTGAVSQPASAATHDYVIVGAGSAGCALANRLSEDPAASVLLIEAGGRDRHPNIKIPAAFAKQFRTGMDWDFAPSPSPTAKTARSTSRAARASAARAR